MERLKNSFRLDNQNKILLFAQGKTHLIVSKLWWKVQISELFEYCGVDTQDLRKKKLFSGKKKKLKVDKDEREGIVVLMQGLQFVQKQRDYSKRGKERE